VIFVIEADHDRVGAALANLESALLKAKLFGNDPQAPRELPVVGKGNAYAVLHCRLRAVFGAAICKDCKILLLSGFVGKAVKRE
jgi:hypothetical protein